jgi:hypothetical protein
MKQFIAIILIFILGALPANAKKARCLEVTSIARIGVPEQTPLTIEHGATDEETRGRYCAFSVDGVAASSPPQEAVADAIASFSRIDIRQLEREEVAESLSYILISASSLSEPPPELIGFFAENGSAIAACLEALYTGSIMEGPEFFSDTRFDAYCFYGSEFVPLNEQVFVDFQIPQLMLYVIDREFGVGRLSLLYVPLT